MYASNTSSAIVSSLSKAEVQEMYEDIIRVQSEYLETLRREQQEHQEDADSHYEERIKEQEERVARFEKKLGTF